MTAESKPQADSAVSTNSAVSTSSTNSTTEPLLAVTKGNPSAEELAAVTAVVLSLGGVPEAEPQRPSARHWARRAQLNLAPKPGPGAWRRSGR